MDTNLLNASARVALVALLHDLGKFAQRAKIEIPKDYLAAHFNFNKEGQYHSHQHAAYTGWAIDLLERRLPDLIQDDVFPFANRSDKNNDITDSMINAAAAHHKPDTFLQWVVATADRVASGFERETFEQYNQAKENGESRREQKNHYQARLFSLLEQISFTSEKKDKNDYCYPLKPLSAKTIFPVMRQGYEPSENSVAQKEYHALWNAFLQGLEQIPHSHRQSWSLWLDHFDSLWQSYTSAIPSATAFGVKPEVSLYDHSKTTAAMATALWRWHHENGQIDGEAAKSLKNREISWGQDKFLLIQGDFFGIQDFIFASGSETNKQAAKLLRGRSFQVSLFSELAALKVLQACELPSTSQITNAAGKFLIVAPNTEKIRSAVKHQPQCEFNATDIHYLRMNCILNA
ncbi:type III-A CRISPR-associated protein Cas10/Csm1 [Testudinibacter sp. P80/BLE/0925]|uniref:type III-A CRISPR-associated protein Cas10/Csm1 n=1 Tax=Testudinibacter sp. TW-1 TaxID=3417757 RepID=UPI003D36B11E